MPVYRKIIGYLRVSTGEQELITQRDAITEYCRKKRFDLNKLQPVATQTPTAFTTQDASSQTFPHEPSNGTAANSPSSASNVAPVHSQRGSAQPFTDATANADSQPAHLATPRDSAMHTANRPTPNRDAVATPKQPRVERVSASSQLISATETVRTMLARLPPDVTSSFTKCMTDRDLSLAGKRILLNESLRLGAENRLNSDVLRMLLRLQLAQNRKQQSGTNVPQPTSMSPSPASRQPAPSSDPASVTQPLNGANDDANSQPIRHATPRDSTVPTANLRTPDGDAAPKTKQLCNDRVSAARAVFARLPSDVKPSFTEFLCDRTRSLAVKGALLTGLLVLDAEDKLNSDSLRMLLQRQLAAEIKERSGTNVPDPRSVSPSSASRQPALTADPVTLNIQEVNMKGGTSSSHVKRRSRFDLTTVGTPTSCPHVDVLDAVSIAGPQASVSCHAGIVSSSAAVTDVLERTSVSPSPASSQPALCANPVTADEEAAPNGYGEQWNSLFGVAQKVVYTNQSGSKGFEIKDNNSSAPSHNAALAVADSSVPSLDMKTVIVPADVPLPPNWAAARTPGDQVYYFHKITL